MLQFKNLNIVFLRNTIIAAISIASFTLISCDDTTETFGSSLVSADDIIGLSEASFLTTAESFTLDSVICRSATPYLGKIKDMETGSYVTAGFMTQFHTFDNYKFPAASLLKDGKAEATSCEIIISYNKYVGDSLALMNCTLHELAKPVEDGKIYYTTFNPMEGDYIRKDGGIHMSKSYTAVDQSVAYSVRNATGYIPYLVFKLNGKYIDKDGKEYNNYGTYLMSKYYENPSNYRNSLSFIKNVCPGFYVENDGGSGSMLSVYTSVINVGVNYADTTRTDTISSFAGTEEVLQLTHFDTDTTKLNALVAENKDCAFLKTPAGVCTKVVLPVDDIMRDKSNTTGYVLRDDTVNVVKLNIARVNNTVQNSYSLPVPYTVLVLPAEEVKEFFEQKKIANNRTSFLFTYSSSSNSYVLSNVSSIVDAMAKKKKAFYDANKDSDSGNGEKWSVDFDKKYAEKFPDWNKIAMVPVTTSYANVGTSSVLSKVSNDISLSSTRIQNGKDKYGNLDPQTAIKVNVIYSKYVK